MELLLGTYKDAVSRKLKLMQKNKISRRIWEADYTVWKPDPNEISNRLGWLTAPSDTLRQLSYISSVLNPVVAEGYRNAVLLGMGGSSLGACVLNKMMGGRKDHPALSILDTTNPDQIAELAGKLDLKKTLFFVSSKSGTTLETVSLFKYFYNLALKKLGTTAASRNFIVITDPGSPLEEIAHRLTLRHVFLSNQTIGGRYSALSFPGIVPAALAGVNVAAVLKNALAAAEMEKTASTSGKSNSPGIELGVVLGTLAQQGRNKLSFILPPSWKPFGGWLEQLIAESTGKEGSGILPLCDEPSSTACSYGNDRLFVIFQSKKKTNAAKLSALSAAGHPVITIKVDGLRQLGKQIFLWEMATATAAHILGVNPFDQPDVEFSKILTNRIIDLYREKKTLPQEKPAIITKEYSVYGFDISLSPDSALSDFLASAGKDYYICLQAFLQTTPEINAALCKLQSAIYKKTRRAVIISYGPRYLHSTGQLYKGDAGLGLFIQFTANHFRDLSIPDRCGISASSLTFGSLNLAQAIGDRRAMADLGRKVIRFHLKHNISVTIKTLAKHLSASCGELTLSRNSGIKYRLKF